LGQNLQSFGDCRYQGRVISQLRRCWQNCWSLRRVAPPDQRVPRFREVRWG